MLSSDLLLLFAGLGFAALSIYLFVSAIVANNGDAQALAWASGNEPVKSKNGLINISRTLVHNLTLQHAVKIKNPNYRKKVRKMILTAGVGSEINEDEFIGLQILWGLFLPVGLVVLNFTMQLGFSYVICIGLGAVGFYLPNLYCRRERQQRYVSIVQDLPFFIDLMALSTEAGLDFMGSLQRIVDKAENSVLADEFGGVLRDIKLGASRREALTSFSERLDIPETTSFVAVVRDADETGASIAAVLKDQSIQMRLERFVRAEKAGARASQAMLIPMMIFILPAVFMIVFAPVALQFFYGNG